MQRLLLLIYNYRAFLVFLFLEVLSGWLIVRNNEYQGAAFFNSSNEIAANLLQTRRGVSDYFKLTKINQNLAKENALLREMVADKNQLYNYLLAQQLPDTLLSSQYDFIVSKVIKNTTRQFNNFLTINRGRKDGVEPGMGVISGNGVVGRVKATSKNYATVASVLHSDMRVSSLLRKSNTFCTTQWGGKDPGKADLHYVPRHIEVNAGDSVVTSGYNAVYPEEIMIGTVSKVDLKPNATFYDIEIDLSTDFSTLSYVYVVNNKFKNEIDSLEVNTTETIQ